MKKLFGFALLILLASGCSTPYQKKDWKALTGGYSESDLGNNSYRILFEGNGVTDLEKTKDFALLRSAELTLEKGFSYFRVDATETKFVDQRSVACNGGTICTPYTIKVPNSWYVISCFRDQFEAGGAAVYDAKAVAASIKGKHRI